MKLGQRVLKVFLFVFLSRIQAQVPFINIFQVPLLLNPSFVGNKDMHRFVMAINQNGTSKYQNTAYQVSYDNFSNRHGLAYGIYALKTDLSRAYGGNDYTDQKEYFEHKILKEKMPIRNLNREVGVVLGIKYNLPRKKGRESATLSPSFGLGTAKEQADYVSGFGKSQLKVFDTLSPKKDSMYYKHQVSHEHHFNTQFGLKYNSTRFTLMYMFGYSMGYAMERHYDWHTASYTVVSYELTNKDMKEIKYINHKFEHRLTMGYSIPQNTESKCGVSLMGSLGVIRFSKSNTPLFFGSDNFKDKIATPLVAHANLSTLLRFRKVISTLAYTQYSHFQSYGAGLGLQTKNFRFIFSCFPKNRSLHSSIEAVLSLYW